MNDSTTNGAIKLIAFDLDGTTLPENKEISPRIREVLRRARGEGMCLVPATGRQLSDIPPFFRDAAWPLLIANNGAQIFSMPGETLIFEQTFEPDTALSLLGELREQKGMIFGACETGGVFDSGVSYGADLIEAIEKRGWKKPFADIETLIRGGKRFIKLVMIFADPEERNRVYGRFRTRQDLSVTSFAADNMEIMARGVNKGEALKWAADRLGIAMENVMALGDGDNDLEMIRAAGLGVAMANAREELKAASRWTTLSCGEDGAAAAIERALEQR
jgi:Cof subfamily protein (haloacid dehalogenase superfamily)